MKSRKRYFLLVLAAALLPLVLVRPALASKEGGLSLYDVILDSPGMDESGSVRVELKRSDEGVEKLLISAFGRNGAAPPQLLQSIKDRKWLNGVQLSYSRGDRLTGGRTIYISLTRGGSWGAVVVAVIAFNEEGKFRMVENLSHKEAEERAAKTALD
jgi:hypothetical protein